MSASPDQSGRSKEPIPRFRSTADDVDLIGPPALKVGGPIHLVCWVHSAAGWTARQVSATYSGRDKDNWYVVVRGQKTRLSRLLWNSFLP